MDHRGLIFFFFGREISAANHFDPINGCLFFPLILNIVLRSWLWLTNYTEILSPPIWLGPLTLTPYLSGTRRLVTSVLKLFSLPATVFCWVFLFLFHSIILCTYSLAIKWLQKGNLLANFEALFSVVPCSPRLCLYILASLAPQIWTSTLSTQQGHPFCLGYLYSLAMYIGKYP